MAENIKKRFEIPEEVTWDLTDIFANDEEWEAYYAQTESMLEEYDSFRGRLSESADVLYAALKLEDEISYRVTRLYVYARQRSDEDTTNDHYQQMNARAQSLSFKADEKSSFMTPEILSMDEALMQEYMRSDNGIGHFSKVLERLLVRKSHVLSGEMEELLAQSYNATQGASSIFNYFNNADIRFPSIINEEGEQEELTHAKYLRLIASKDQRVRKDAFEALYQVYKQYSNTLAATFESNVKTAVFYAKARKYNSSQEAALSANEIPVSVYDNLIHVVREHLPLMHRYVALRKKALGLSDIHMYDLYTPISKGAEKKVSFSEAKEIVLEALKPLGEEYLSHIKEGFENRWIDVYENEGKRSGAYSWGVYGTHPCVLLNYNDTMNSVFTLAHEMGHALHTYYSDHAQPFTYANYVIFVAEVASTCNESLLVQHLLKKTNDKEERIELLNYFLETFKGTLFRQTMFAEFEQWAHKMVEEGNVLTAKNLCAKYHELNEAYFGPEMCVDEQIDYEWARIPHFYTPFYVYQYATGLSAAIAISNQILAGNEEVKKGYLSFLQGGCSDSPIELLKRAKVDMNEPEPIEEALALFGRILDEMEELL